MTDGTYATGLSSLFSTHARGGSESLLANATPAELRDLIDQLARDANYGCYTRQGLELVVWPQIRDRARWIIFADLDGLHQLNDIHGHEEMNRRIRESISLRKTDIAAAGRWYSGDELIWILCDAQDRPPSHPKQAAARLLESFQQFGISATFGICRVLSYDLAANVEPAHRLVQQSKHFQRRGIIRQTGSLKWSPFGGRS